MKRGRTYRELKREIRYGRDGRSLWIEFEFQSHEKLPLPEKYLNSNAILHNDSGK
jgi:hypothetical protein